MNIYILYYTWLILLFGLAIIILQTLNISNICGRCLLLSRFDLLHFEYFSSYSHRREIEISYMEIKLWAVHNWIVGWTRSLSGSFHNIRMFFIELRPKECLGLKSADEAMRLLYLLNFISLRTKCVTRKFSFVLVNWIIIII